MRRQPFLVAVAILALSLATTGLAMAAPKTQQPITYLVKVVTSEQVAHPGGLIHYYVQFGFSSDVTNVTVEDNFLDDLDLFPTSPSVVWVKTSSFLNRNTYETSLGSFQGSGTDTFLVTGQVSPNKKAGPGQYVRNSVNLYVNGQWKGAATVMTPVLP